LARRVVSSAARESLALAPPANAEKSAAARHVRKHFDRTHCVTLCVSRRRFSSIDPAHSVSGRDRSTGASQLNSAVIYAKTAKGAAEVARRSGALSLAARRILIMIDGWRPVSELAPYVAPGEIDGILATLEAKGMIEEYGFADGPADAGEARDGATFTRQAEEAYVDTVPIYVHEARPEVAAVAPPTVTTSIISIAPAPAPAAASNGAAQTLDESKRVAVRALFERLGPYGEAPAARIQGCTTVEALRAEVHQAGRRIATFRGEKAAQEYLHAVGFA
jgi:hypothetical protein